MKFLLKQLIFIGLRHPVLSFLFAIAATAIAAIPLARASFSADITQMLPAGSESERTCRVLLESGLFNQSAVLFTAKSPQTLADASDAIDAAANQISKIPGITRVENRFLPDDLASQISGLSAWLPQFQKFEGLDPDTIAVNVRNRLLRGGITSFITNDPAGFAASRLAELEQFRTAASFRLREGESALISPDGCSRLILLESDVPASDSAGGAKLLSALEKILGESALSDVKADLLLTHTHTLENERVIKSDVKQASILSIFLIIPAILLLFRGDLRAALIPLFPAAASLAAAGLPALAGKPVLLFVTATGGLVIGLAVDYAVHVYIAMQTPGPERRLVKLAPPLLTGAATSAAVFLFLALTGIEGVRQFGVFIGVSLLLSLLLTLLLFPAILKTSKRHPLPPPKPPFRFHPAAAVCIWIGLMAALLIPSVCRLTVRTDLRQFDAAQAKIGDMAESVERIFLNEANQGILAIHGRDANEAMERAAMARSILIQADPSLAEKIFSPTQLVPPESIRRANLSGWQESFQYESFAKSLRAAAEREGFADDAFDDFLSALKRGLDNPDTSGIPPVFAPVMNRMIRPAANGNGWYAAVFLPDAALKTASLPPELEAVPISRSSVPDIIVSDMKTAARLPVILAVLSVFVIAFCYFGNLLDSVSALIPAAAGLLSVCGVYAALGQPLDLAAEMALVLLCGLAIDYGVFIIGAERSANPYVFRAVTASAITTIAGGFTIAFAEHPMLRGAGRPLILGILAAWTTAVFLLPSIRIWLLRFRRTPRRRGLSISAAALLILPVWFSACRSMPFEYDPIPPLSETEWVQNQGKTQPPQTPMQPFSFQGKVSFEYGFSAMATLCAVSFDRNGVMRIAAFSPSGGKIFEIAGTKSGAAESWFMPNDFVKGHESETAESILADLFHIFDGISPWRGTMSGAVETIRGSRMIERRETADDGTGELVSEFWGTKMTVMRKYFLKNGKTDWQSCYFRYIVKDTVFFPERIVYDNEKYGYRLILSVSNLFEDDEL